MIYCRRLCVYERRDKRRVDVARLVDKTRAERVTVWRGGATLIRGEYGRSLIQDCGKFARDRERRTSTVGGEESTDDCEKRGWVRYQEIDK